MPRGSALMLTRDLSGPDWRSPPPRKYSGTITGIRNAKQQNAKKKKNQESQKSVFVRHTSRRKSTAMIWKVGLILRMVWISFHSLATK